jgi:hypothetical protein
MTSFEEILESAKQLSSEQRLQLADALLALEQPGNGKISLEDFERDMDFWRRGSIICGQSTRELTRGKISIRIMTDVLGRHEHPVTISAPQ